MKYQLMNRWNQLVALSLLSAAVLPASAEQADSFNSTSAMPAPQDAPDTTERPTITVSAGLSEQFQSSVDSGGNISISRYQGGVAAPFRLNDVLVLNTSFKYGVDCYNFDGVSPRWLGAWRNINTYTFGTWLQWKMDEHWSFYGGGLIRESGETAAEFESGITGGGILGFNYKYSDTLSFGLGVGVMSQLEDNINVLPLATVNWQFADKWHLKVGLTDVATDGYGAVVSYAIAKDWEWNLGVQHQKSRFRIDGTKTRIVTSKPPYKILGPSKKGVGQEESSVLYTEAVWHAASRVYVSGYVGLTLAGDLRLENQFGNEITSSNYDPAAIVGFKASIVF